MGAILIDTTVLLVPPADAQKQEVVAWLEQLMAWLRESSISHDQWYHCADLVFRQYGYARFPTFQVLTIWQRKYQLDIDIHQIITAFTALVNGEELSLEAALEQEVQALDGLIEAQQGTTSISPDVYLSRYPAPLQEEMSQLIVLAAVAQSLQVPLAVKLSLAVHLFPDPAAQLWVSGVASRITDDEQYIVFPIQACFPFWVLSPEQRVQNEIEMWMQGEQGARAVILAVFEQTWGRNGLQPLSFSFGPQFFSSLRQHRLESDRVVLLKLIRVVASILADSIHLLNCDLHPLYVGDPPGQAQQVRARDGARAWRLALVNRKVGWRLHYWRVPSPDGGVHIELARVLKKHEPERIE